LIETYLDVIESFDFTCGAHIWNFADFLAPQNFRRVVLNRKGVFTRTRHPKQAAFRLRARWKDAASFRGQSVDVAETDSDAFPTSSLTS